MIAHIAACLRPTQKEIEDLAIRETSLSCQSEFTAITAGPIAALALMGVVGLAAVPVGLWRLLRSGTRTGGN